MPQQQIMSTWKGEASSKTGLALILSSTLLFMLSLNILNVWTWPGAGAAPSALALLPPSFASAYEYFDTDDMLPMKVLLPLASVPYLVWLIVKHVSLELYLSN